MRIRLTPWQSLLLLAVIVSVVLFSIDRFRYRVVRSNADLVGLLPQTAGTTFFIDVAALRRAHVLNLLAAPQPAEERDYREFILETGFDYTRDAELIAGTADPLQTFFVMRGRFDWGRLASYAGHHGGSCSPSECRVPTSRPGRWASFRTIQPDVVALAVSAVENAVRQVRAANQEHRRSIPADPVWVRPAHALLSDPASLPLPARIFAIALQSSEEVTFSVGPGSSIDRAPLELKLRARYENAAMADTTRTQLEMDTKMLKLELAREHAQPNPADLTGLLVSGTFQVVGNDATGIWPIQQELLNRLQ